MGKISRISASLLGALLALAPAMAFAQDNSAAGNAAGAGIGVAMLCCYGIFFIALIALFVLWLWMLIDVVKRPDDQFTGGMSKVIWIVLMVLFSYITAIVYYFAMYRKLGKSS